ncbi:TetR/AcrR family transcriptional regulator [Paenibacillus taiwanensis]|uniref:TetR/AcrR family transcriptional regulator n=1 Tax=Paenibacillus taiwanensis TaxID=401638 RepID=UPI000419C6E3|nr:TetR/AcrR family transcriptional regulator [Paenibacillus taiwanensis]
MIKGKELFIKYGLKKTSIDEIVNACGIAKGSFYTFFNSKEELYYAIMKQEEAFKDAMIQEMINSDRNPQELLHDLFTKSFDMLESNPFLQRVIRKEEYELLIRKVPKEMLESHSESDNESGAELIAKWKSNRLLVDEEPDIIIGLLRAVVLISLHREEIGTERYDKVKTLLIKCVAEGLIQK